MLNNEEGYCTMSKVKLLLASTLLAFAVGAIATASASAEETKEEAEFVIEGTKAGATETLGEASTEFERSLILEAKGEPRIGCDRIKVVGETIKDDSTTATIGALDFENCEDLSNPAKCSVSSIDTNELEVRLEPSGKLEKDTVEKFKPKSGSEVAHFKLKGSECNETKELKIDGAFTSEEEDHEAKAEKELPVNIDPFEIGELEYGGQPALLVLSFRIRAPVPWGLCRHPHNLLSCPFG
jgi:hypothetical protein